jgi:hypothetical protein
MNCIHGFYLFNGCFNHSILFKIKEDRSLAATERDPENWTGGQISGLFSNSELSL